MKKKSVLKTQYDNIFSLKLQNILWFKKKLILKTWHGINAIVLAMEKECTQDHATDLYGVHWYHVSKWFNLENSKYVKCHCNIPSPPKCDKR